MASFIKNVNLSKKMFVAFFVVVLICTTACTLSIFRMKSLSKNDEEMYQFSSLSMKNLASMYDNLASQRVCLSNAVIFLTADPEFSREELADLKKKESDFEEALKEYSNSLADATEEALYSRIETNYHKGFTEGKTAVLNAISSGNALATTNAIKVMDSSGSNVSNIIDEAFQHNATVAKDKVTSNQDLYAATRLLLILTIIICAFISLSLAFLLTTSISRPLRRIMEVAKHVGEQGNFQVNPETIAAVRQDAYYQDEIGQTAAAFAAMMDAIVSKMQVLDYVADGDLTVQVPMVSSNDSIGLSLEKMIQRLNDMFSEINLATIQVSSGADQIALTAQAMAQGANEQAATVEEISASIAEISSQTNKSTITAKDAAAEGATIKEIALDGNLKMQNMMHAVQEINEASISIEKVIRVIDDIAFQTNILALNAAVEAARAGEHGKGFAVVADEVRNLAAKSAGAAKETSALISDNIEKTQLGLSIANETAQSLEKIVTGIQMTSDSLQTVSEQSENISASTAQINIAVDQVAEVVQQNSATSQESAAAGEEMSSQAQALRQLVARFKLKE